jgi:hypothetical protein
VCKSRRRLCPMWHSSESVGSPASCLPQLAKKGWRGFRRLVRKHTRLPRSTGSANPCQDAVPLKFPVAAPQAKAHTKFPGQCQQLANDRRGAASAAPFKSFVWSSPASRDDIRKPSFPLSGNTPLFLLNFLAISHLPLNLTARESLSPRQGFPIFIEPTSNCALGLFLVLASR